MDGAVLLPRSSTHTPAFSQTSTHAAPAAVATLAKRRGEMKGGER